jgi:hypothetical protein
MNTVSPDPVHTSLKTPTFFKIPLPSTGAADASSKEDAKYVSAREKNEGQDYQTNESKKSFANVAKKFKFLVRGLTIKTFNYKILRVL